LVAAITVLTLGWRLFGPFVQEGVGLGGVSPDDVMAAIRVFVQGLADELQA